MKSNISIIVLIIALALVMFLNNRRVNRLEHQLSIQTAKTNFVTAHCSNQTTIYDSIYANDNTIAFYKNGTLLSKSVTTTE